MIWNSKYLGDTPIDLQMDWGSNVRYVEIGSGLIHFKIDTRLYHELPVNHWSLLHDYIQDVFNEFEIKKETCIEINAAYHLNPWVENFAETDFKYLALGLKIYGLGEAALFGLALTVPEFNVPTGMPAGFNGLSIQEHMLKLLDGFFYIALGFWVDFIFPSKASQKKSAASFNPSSQKINVYKFRVPHIAHELVHYTNSMVFERKSDTPMNYLLPNAYKIFFELYYLKTDPGQDYISMQGTDLFDRLETWSWKTEMRNIVDNIQKIHLLSRDYLIEDFESVKTDKERYGIQDLIAGVVWAMHERSYPKQIVLRFLKKLSLYGVEDEKSHENLMFKFIQEAKAEFKQR